MVVFVWREGSRYIICKPRQTFCCDEFWPHRMFCQGKDECPGPLLSGAHICLCRSKTIGMVCKQGSAKALPHTSQIPGRQWQTH